MSYEQFAASGGWEALVEALRSQVHRAHTLEEAAQRVSQGVWEALPDATALVRVFAVAAREDLPGDVRAFVDDHAARKHQEGLLSPTTPVLALVGTYGRDPRWRDRRASTSHQGIPLVSAAFVEAIPSLARLLQELGLELAWLDEAPGVLLRRLSGGFNGVFYVADARDARDARGRLVVPESTFVAEEEIRSVFGMGGFYPDGTMIACIVFARETVPRHVVDELASLIAMLKTETFGAVLAHRVFTRRSDAQRSKQ